MTAHAAATWSAALFLSVSLFSHTVALRLLFLFAGAGLALYTVVRRRQDVRALPPIWVPFLLWGAWAAASTLWSIEPDRTIKELRNEILYAGLAFWVCFIAAQAPRSARALLSTTAVAAATVCVISGYYFTKGFWIYATGPHGGAGNHSSALLSLLPGAALAGWLSYRRRSAILPWVAAALALMFLLSGYATLNRTFWAGFAVQALIIGGWFIRRNHQARLSGKVKVAATAVAVACMGLAGAVVMQVQENRTSLVNEGRMSEDPRLGLWEGIVERIQQRPLTGYGFGRGTLREDLKDISGNPTLWHSHNLLLDTVLQVGLPGLMLLLFLLAWTAATGWRLSRSTDDIAAACGIALVAIVAGMLVRNMTDMLWVRQNALLYWGLVGVLLAWGTAHRDGAQR